MCYFSLSRTACILCSWFWQKGQWWLRSASTSVRFERVVFNKHANILRTNDNCRIKGFDKTGVSYFKDCSLWPSNEIYGGTGADFFVGSLIPNGEREEQKCLEDDSDRVQDTISYTWPSRGWLKQWPSWIESGGAKPGEMEYCIWILDEQEVLRGKWSSGAFVGNCNARSRSIL